MLDVLIHNGRVIDGIGNPWFHAGVGVENGRIRILREDLSSIEAARNIDADGMVVCPGFIDMHTHSGLMLLHQPRNEPKIHQGVTTELIGVDGNSYAPLTSEEDFDQFLLLNAGIDGSPPLPKRWSTVDEYLSLFNRRVANNVAYVIGNSPLRINAMGWDNRRPTGEEIEAEKTLLRQGMEEGAFGMSTGLTYPPGSFADTNELIELCQEVNRLGGIYVTHVRYTLGDQFLDPYKEAIHIARASGVPLQISHFHSPLPGGARKLLALLDEALDDGLDVTYDSYSYPYSSTRLESVLPEWAHEGGVDHLLEMMSHKKSRQRMAADLSVRAPSWDSVLVTNFTKPHNRRWEGKSVAAIADGLDMTILDAVCDLLLEEDMNLCYTADNGNPVNIREFFKHPNHMVGSDGLLIGDHINPRTYGCFPRVLGEFVREDGLLTLTDAVRRMTSFPAQRLGLSDRGRLANGMMADLVVFDPKTVGTKATLEDPKQLPDGIPYVLVNGQLVVDRGVHTGATPGVALRHKVNTV